MQGASRVLKPMLTVCSRLYMYFPIDFLMIDLLRKVDKKLKENEENTT